MDAPRTRTAFTSLRDMVLRRVRADIVSGHSAPGTMYSVPTLAEELGVSTTPVREALLELSHSGLDHADAQPRLPGRGDLARRPEERVRAARAAGALRDGRLAEKRLTDTENLRKLADDDRRGRADARTAAATSKPTARFTWLWCRVLDNPMLTKLIMELRDGMRLYGMDSAAGRQRQVASVKEHYQLIDLAVAGETEAIAKLITQHILSWEPVFTAALKERLDSSLVRSRGR